MTNSQHLIPETLPLSGCHLIEASAGTGKTYNITRIYLRLLLERKMDVKNILVMTFTRAATEELRARIAQEIRYAMEEWGQFDPNDSFFTALTEQFSIQDVYPALHHALLHLDEAAIFTIHGFCKRVLSQYAFASGVDFNVQMEADTVDIELEAVRDWYRILAKQAQTNPYQLLSKKWPSPDTFYQSFRELLSSTVMIETHSPEMIQEIFYQQKKEALALLQAEKTLVFAQLIDRHKDKDKRAEEWQQLILWLSTHDLQAMPKSASSVFNGNRYGRKEASIKKSLNDIFDPIKHVRKNTDTIEEQIQKAYSYQIAQEGIVRIRDKISQAKQQARVMNYDDLIHQLASAVATQEQLPALIREQYPVALVDEFQDTDPQQYAILKAVYQESESALYMIGDPKQAIYAFRSGDVFTYLKARSDADAQWLMNTNWRSSSGMIRAYNRLFYGASLEQSAQDVFSFGIDYTPVKAAGNADKTPLTITPNTSAPALQFIYFPFNENYKCKRIKKEQMTQSFCAVMASWCSSEIHRLLTEKTLIGEQVLQEHDIAILVRDKKEANYIQDALRISGYPSVYLSTHDNVFFSQEATELQQALMGILNLENDQLLITALSTHYFSCDTADLFALKTNEIQWERYRDNAFQLREIWFKRGFMAMALSLLHQNYIPNPQYHERSLTNAIQLLELLQHASQKHKQAEQLLHWFDEHINANNASIESELRLESDANLIRIITQHGCKGLEYPIVFIPFATRHKDPTKFGNKTLDLFKYHDEKDQQLRYFIGQDTHIRQRYREEMYAENIRLLYVAITRAEHRCYLCVTPFQDFHLSALGQTLKLSAEDHLQQSLQTLVDSEPESIAVQCISDIEFPVVHDAVTEQNQSYSPARFIGHIERNWWLSSFTALTRNLRHGGLSTPDRDQDESLNGVNNQRFEDRPIRFTLTKGAATGNLLHDILEQCDFSQPHWYSIMERPLSRFNESLEAQQYDDLIQWLEECLASPLKDDVKGIELTLNELTWKDTLRESEFYFPMEQVNINALGKLLAKHRQQRNNLDVLTPVFLQTGNHLLKGMMHGFIDLIFHYQDQYFLIDYKSTYLGHTLADYQPNALDKNMQDNYYDLQYLLYSLALHRYLKNRLEDYDPALHFGGVFYLYLRGMSPKSDTGVFHTAISIELLDELDALFSEELASV